MPRPNGNVDAARSSDIVQVQIAEVIGCAPIRVYEVATVYTIRCILLSSYRLQSFDSKAQLERPHPAAHVR